jgi:hypothetical protein
MVVQVKSEIGVLDAARTVEVTMPTKLDTGHVAVLIISANVIPGSGEVISTFLRLQDEQQATILIPQVRPTALYFLFSWVREDTLTQAPLESRPTLMVQNIFMILRLLSLALTCCCMLPDQRDISFVRPTAGAQTRSGCVHSFVHSGRMTQL